MARRAKRHERKPTGLNSGPRVIEHPGKSDERIILYHKMLEEQMDRIARVEGPMGVIRDRSRHELFINLKRERTRLEAFELEYEDTFDTPQREAATTWT